MNSQLEAFDSKFLEEKGKRPFKYPNVELKRVLSMNTAQLNRKTFLPQMDSTTAAETYM